MCKRHIGLKGSEKLGWFLAPHGAFDKSGLTVRCPGGGIPVK